MLYYSVFTVERGNPNLISGVKHLNQSYHTSVVRLLSVIVLAILISAKLNAQFYRYENGGQARPDVLHFSGAERSIIDLAGRWSYTLADGIVVDDLQVPSSLSYEGRITFTRKFTADTSMVSNGGFTLAAYGINYSCQIFINEIFIGKHEGGYTSFSFTVPPNTIQSGAENVIRVMTDNQLGAKNTIPLRQQIGGFKNYAGILRDIFLVHTPCTWIENLSVITESIDVRGVHVAVKVNVTGRDLFPPGFTKSASLAIEVIEKNSGVVVGRGSSVLTPMVNKDVAVQMPMTIVAKPWSIDDPVLYTVRAVLTAADGQLIDETSVGTGFRTIATQKNKILLNGSPIIIRGVAWMEDSHLHGASLSYEEMEKDIALIKNLGANTVRCAFHPPHPYIIDLCDRYGLMVMEDVPLFEVPGKIASIDNYRQLAENYLREMIQRDRNHPSVVAWGVGDGVQDADEGTGSLAAALHRFVNDTDGRLTYGTSRFGAKMESSTDVDIAAVSISTNEAKDFRTMLQEWIAAHPSQPVIVSGYGKKIELGNRNGYSDPMSQEAQARYILQRFNVIKEIGIAGGVVWAFNDWRGDRPILTVKLKVPELMTGGIVELDREKKIAYDIVRSMYLGEKSAALPIGTASPGSPVSYVLVGLTLLILFAWLINSNRRFRDNVTRAMFRPYNFFADVRDQRVLSPIHSALLAVIVSITFAIIFSSIVFHFRTNTAFDYILTHLLGDTAKYAAIQLIWNVPLCIIVVSVFMVIWFSIVTLLVQGISSFVKARVTLYHAFAVSVWSTLPWIFFIPLSMIVFRIMEDEIYVIPVLVLCFGICMWIFFRIIKGMSVIYDVLPVKAYTIAFTAVFIIICSVYATFDYYFSTGAYIGYFITMVLPSIR